MKKKLTNIEDTFKSQLADYSEWDGDDTSMWEAIESEIDKKKKKVAAFWWFFGSLIAISVVGIGLWNIEGISNASGSQVSNLTSIDSGSQLQECSSEFHDIKVDKKNSEIQEEKIMKQQTIDTKNNGTKDLINIKSGEADHKKRLHAARSIDTQINTPEIPVINKWNASRKNEKLSQNTEFSGSPTRLNLEHKSEIIPGTYDNSRDFVNTSMLASSKYNQKLSYVFDTLENPCYIVNYIPEKDVETMTSKFSVAYFRGINYHTDGYHFGSEDNALRKSSERGLMGSEEGINFEYKFGKNYIISMGVGMSNYWERFDYTVVTPDEILENNVVIRYNVNTITMDTTFIIGNRTTEVVTERNIRHYNSWRMLRIPVQIGKEWQMNKSSFTLLTGMSVERRIAQETKDITNDFELYIQSNSRPFRKYGMNIELTPSYERRITSKLSASLSMPMRAAMVSWDYRERTADLFTQKTPMIIALDVGLKYYL